MIDIQETLHIGIGHYQAGRFAEAESMYRRILSVFPDHAEALHLLGVLAVQACRYDMAMELIARAITANPSNPEYCYNLGTVLLTVGKLERAAFFFRRAIAINNDYFEAYCNLGYVLKLLGRLDEAVFAFRKALSINPNHAEPYHNLGTSLYEQGKMHEAAESYHNALALDPNHAEAHNNLGIVLRVQGKLQDSVTSFRKALSLQQGFAIAHYNLGIALYEQGKLDEAACSYRKAFSLKPDYTSALSNLIYLHAYSHNISPEAECSLAAKWEAAALNEDERRQAHERKFDYPPRAGRKLRIGVVSAEIGKNCVAEFLEPVLEHLDRGRFHVMLYPTTERPEARSTRLKNLADAVVTLVSHNDNIAADRIRSDRIDILIDTTGHTNGFRLGIFAHRAAPVQCHYIGYFGTTGLTEMDWYIADEVLLPVGYDAHFREGIWRLPRLWVGYRGDESLTESNWRPNPDGTICLGSFNNLAKVREETLGLWAKVMNALPEAKLLLKDHRALNPEVQQRIRSELNRHGIGDNRIEFVAVISDWSSHMALYDRLDIALDTIPLNSGTTAYDALWMGVPIVALEGDWMGGRMTTSILTALGKPEWIARSPEEYVEIVVALARDVAGRSELRGRQRQLMAASQLCDGRGLARALEDAFEAMYDKWEAVRDASRMAAP